MKEKKVKPMNMDIGISDADRKKIAEGLSGLQCHQLWKLSINII